MTTQNETHLSGAQIDSLQRQFTAALDMRVRQMDLRKWAVDAAIKIIANSSADITYDAVKLSQGIYDFVVRPSEQVNVKIAL